MLEVSLLFDVIDTSQVCKWQSCHLRGWSKATLQGTYASRTCWLRSVWKQRSVRVTSSWKRLGRQGIEPLGAGSKKEPALDSHLWGLHSLITTAQSLYIAQDGCACILSVHNGESVDASSIFIYGRGFDKQPWPKEGTAWLLVLTTEQIGCSVTSKKTGFIRDNTKTFDISTGASGRFCKQRNGEHTLHSCTSSVWCLLLRNLTLSSNENFLKHSRYLQINTGQQHFFVSSRSFSQPVLVDMYSFM